ncbi:hypothetical protein E8E13_000621 [Curvularia kusanoi]|uniref:Uncharacterized protein n=1 Tax=Curvularia kusanoi TaxID=90978 RepID=A0A9P4W571_CURKU|nr:hypothetical protein E8E13_000621 [Curvularia kusanoi]
MSAQLFDNQLLFPDNTESQKQIVALISAGKYTGPRLPDVAHNYLDAFCNPGCSDGRRRWAGVALVGMMRASAAVVQRLKKLTRGPSRVGNIILDPEESEEHKIVAGLIIRQGLEAGMDFTDFWASDRVPHSAPNFPEEAGEPWMDQFQTYLDTLSSLKLTDSATDATILYPMSIFTDGDLQWTGRSAVATIEKGRLTVVVSNSTLTKFHFIELPVSHIKKIDLRQESPYASQEGHSEHSMHTLAMMLQPESPIYRLDSSEHKASEFRISFHRRDDAAEFEARLQDACKSMAMSAAKTTGSARKNTLRQAPRQSSTELVSSDQPEKRRGSSNQAVDEKRNGKLRRVSKATIAKVAQTQNPQSGSSKTTKTRATKSTAAIVISSSDQEESVEPSGDEYDSESVAKVRSSASTGTGRSTRARRRVHEEDEGFTPKGLKPRPKSTKRKRGSSDAAEQIQSLKKKSQKLDDTTQPSTNNPTAGKENAPQGNEVRMDASHPQKPKEQPAEKPITQKGISVRPSLIGSLIKSKSPIGAAAAAFKRPGQPASTPGRARTQRIQTTPRSRTPVNIHRDLEDLPVLPQTSTPRSQLIHAEDFGVGHTPVNTEILSSNTKKVPDSPHAESTAISGHADQDEVHMEKYRGDLETAKSDPFQKRRGQKNPTHFLRKLTGESSVEDSAKHEEPSEILAEPSQEDHEADELPSGLSCNKITRTERATSFFERSSPAPRTAARRSRSFDMATAEERVQQNGSVISALPEAIDDTLPDALDYRAGIIDPDDETTLIDRAIDPPERRGEKGYDLQFPSSPPVRASSSVRDGSSDASEPEPSPPTSRADEIEWEAALQPHQRNLHDQLLRTSKQVVRHIVDNETAVTDVADAFAEDGERLVDMALERQCEQSAKAFQELAGKKQELLKEFTAASEHLRLQRQQAEADN